MPLTGAAKRDYQKYYNATKKIIKPFVAIDSEGVSYGDPVKLGDDFARPQRTIFWMAGNSENGPLTSEGGPFLSTEDILNFLLSLPAHFGPSQFVWFGSSYDATQLFLDLPFEKAWELQNGRPFADRGLNRQRKQTNRFTFWNGYALSYIKQKCLIAGRLANPDRPYSYGSNGTRKLELSQRIIIFDVFGFFQTSFLKAAKSIPGAMTSAEEKILIEGKKSRASFELENRAEMQRYTSVELCVLARMMEKLRESLTDLNLNLTRWQGAGSIAAALLKKHDARKHFAAITSSDLSREQEWAHHAFFGGRIECLKQGRTTRELFSYDIRSAYPYHMSRLPSMDKGTFHHVENPTRKMVENSNVLSMFKVRLDVDVSSEPHSLNQIYGCEGPHFYPLPYRDDGGRITYPPRVFGIYMAEEIRGCLHWIDTMRDFYKNRARNPFEIPIRFIVEEGLIFEPWNDDEPFAWLRDLYDERRVIVEKAERSGDYDLTEKVIKLGINSVYGKTAQSVGSVDRPPGTACPWYAAAITAGTRAQLLRAALRTNRSGIVAFQTDGVVASARLETVTGVGIGQWEFEEITGTSIFVQPGVYQLGKKSKHRGIKADLLGTDDFEEWLNKNAGDKWAAGASSVSYPYRYYMTLGASVASEERWKVAGHWVDGTRELQLDNLGFKRAAPISSELRKKRSQDLVATIPKPAYFHNSEFDGDLPLSAPHRPDWLDPDAGAENELEMLNEEIAICEE